MDRFTKRLTDFKAAPDGSVEAVIATLNVKDHDGDVTLPGFFGSDHPTVIVGSHDWSQIMLGKGRIREDGEQAVFSGKFNLDDPEAKALHSKLMYDLANPPAAIEWSYGFEVLPGGRKAGQHAGEQVSFLGPLDDGSPGAKVWEVSPVMAGAGIGTGTLAAKTRPTLRAKVDAALTALAPAAESVDDLLAKLDAGGAALTQAKVSALLRFGDGLTAALESVTKVLEQGQDGEEDGDDGDSGGEADDEAKVGDLDLLQAQFSQYAGATDV